MNTRPDEIGDHPYKCYLEEVASVGDSLKICPWVTSRVESAHQGRPQKSAHQGLRHLLVGGCVLCVSLSLNVLVVNPEPCVAVPGGGLGVCTQHPPCLLRTKHLRPSRWAGRSRAGASPEERARA